MSCTRYSRDRVPSPVRRLSKWCRRLTEVCIGNYRYPYDCTCGPDPGPCEIRGSSFLLVATHGMRVGTVSRSMYILSHLEISVSALLPPPTRLYELPSPTKNTPSRISPKPKNFCRVKGSLKNRRDQSRVQIYPSETMGYSTDSCPPRMPRA